MEHQQSSSKEAILGVNLDGSTLHVARVRQGRIENRIFRRISSEAAEHLVLAQIFGAVDRVMSDDIAGIGFGVPSVVDTEGVVHAVQNIPSWREVRLKELLEERYGLPTLVDNDANAFAVGELYFGAGRGTRDLAGVILGTGLGLGLVSDERLCRGANCGAGEIGCMPYQDENFEHYASLKLFERCTRLQEVLLRSRAEKGDAQAQRVYQTFGAHLGKALQVVLYAYDPATIVLGGPLAGAFPLFESSMRRSLAAGFDYPHVLESLRIEATQLSDGPVLGAAAIYLDYLRREARSDSS